MKKISTLAELRAYLAESAGRVDDLAEGGSVPQERLEQHLLAGGTILAPETEAEEEETAEAAVREVVGRIARRAGWKAAAKHVLAIGGQPPLTGKRLASFAAYLRKKYT